MLGNFFLIIINILIMIFGFLAIKKYFDNRYLNSQILDKIKSEINEIIRQLNSETDRNITVVKEQSKIIDKKVQELKTYMNLVGETTAKLQENVLKYKIELQNRQYEQYVAQENVAQASNVYSMQQIAKKTNATQLAEQEKLQREQEEKQKIEQIKSELEGLEKSEQVLYLQKLKWSNTKIQEFLDIPPGEFEFIQESLKTETTL